MGLSQSDLAKAVGVHQSQISRLEAGKSLPSHGVMLRIANALGVDVADLMRSSRDEAA